MEAISNDHTKIWSTIIAGAIFLIVITLSAIFKPRDLKVGIFGYALGYLIFSIAAPLTLIYNEVLLSDNTPPNSLLERDGIEFTATPNICNKNKYGRFLIGIDTLIRYKEEGRELEIIKRIGQEDKIYYLKWLDACSYVRIQHQGIAAEYVQLGNFDDGSHQIFIRPAKTHTLDEEYILTLFNLEHE